MTEITFQTKNERIINSIIDGRSTSYYNCSDDIIKLIYWNNKNSFKFLINDLDHEVTHVILHKLINIRTSIEFDNTSLQLECAVGFKNPNHLFDSLIVNGCIKLASLKNKFEKIKLVIRY